MADVTLQAQGVRLEPTVGPPPARASARQRQQASQGASQPELEPTSERRRRRLLRCERQVGRNPRSALRQQVASRPEHESASPQPRRVASQPKPKRG